MAKSDAMTACMPSCPLMPTPMCAAGRKGCWQNKHLIRHWGMTHIECG